MFQERYPGQGPNFQPPHGPFRQQQKPFQRMPQANFLQQRPQQPQMGRQQRPNVPFQQQTPKKGLLGKIFGKSNQTPQNLFAPPSGMRKNETRSGGGILDTLKNPEGLNTMLNNTQRVLQAAEQFTPMIQQYGPIVKNLPSIWKLMRAFNSSDTSSDTKKEETEPKTKTKTTAKKQQDFTEPEIEKKATRHTKKERSESVPKLYI